jgi:predicted PurR-regulated permease PerM
MPMSGRLCHISLFLGVETLDYTYILSKLIVNILVFLFLIFLIYYLINIGNKYVVYRKKIKLDRRYKLIIFLSIVVILIILLLYIFRSIIISILIPILWAIVIAYLINPLVNKMCDLRLSRFWSVVIIYLGIFLLLLVFSMTIIPKISVEVKEFAESLPEYTNEAIEFSNNIYIQYLNSVSNLPPEFIGVQVAFGEYLNRIQLYLIDLFKDITEKGLNIFSNIVGIVLVPIYTFYFLKDTRYFKRKVLLSVPKIIRTEVISIFKDISKLLNSFIRGQLVVAALVGILSVIALLILKVEFALLIGAIAGISNVIPYFGPIMGAIPGVAIALLDKPIKAVWVIVAFFIIQQIESAIIQPKIVGDSVGLHPVFVIISLLIGGELFGIVGLLFAVPIAASIRVVLNHIMKILVKI